MFRFQFNWQLISYTGFCNRKQCIINLSYNFCIIRLQTLAKLTGKVGKASTNI